MADLGKCQRRTRLGAGISGWNIAENDKTMMIYQGFTRDLPIKNDNDNDNSDNSDNDDDDDDDEEEEEDHDHHHLIGNPHSDSYTHYYWLSEAESN